MKANGGRVSVVLGRSGPGRPAESAVVNGIGVERHAESQRNRNRQAQGGQHRQPTLREEPLESYE